MTAFERAIDAAERGWIPDPVLRWAIRRACAARLRSEARARRSGDDAAATAAVVRELAQQPIAVATVQANAQHYEVPADFFREVLGPRLKYSCCWWGDGASTLAEAEASALDLTIARAGLADGQRILELGCGWGSLTLEMAARFPAASIVALSNAAGQRRFIEAEARRRGLDNVTVHTADINAYTPAGDFDRIVSVEMFEHLRNHTAMFARLARWLRPGGSVFIHVFCHRRFAYPFESDGAGNWMGRHFFSGGLMPSLDLLPSIPGPLALEQAWQWPGGHYARTANAWLANLDAARDGVVALLASGGGDGARAFHRWRLFFLACAELFATADGREWGVAHYRFVHAPGWAGGER